MSARHTPGPWELDDLGNVCSQAVHNIALVFSSSTREGWSGSDLDTQAHCEANARLIAAAPELLDMAECLRAVCARIIEQYGPVQCGVDFAALGGSVNRVISKATGGEQ